MGKDVFRQEIGWMALAGKPEAMDLSHSHMEIEFNYLLRGSASYFTGQTTQALAEKTLSIFWGALPHRLTRVSPDCEMAWITIPLADLLKWDLPPDVPERLLQGEWLSLPPDHLEEQNVRRWIEEIGTRGHPWRTAALLEMNALLYRLSGQGSGRISLEGGRVEAMTRHIMRHATGSLSVAQVAQAARVHPNHANRIFKAVAGRTILEYITEVRMAAAQRLLLTTDTPIDHLWSQAGFSSASQFFEVFKRRTGQTPLQWKKANRG
jgi:AraC-like DNA-binding protein